MNENGTQYTELGRLYAEWFELNEQRKAAKARRRKTLEAAEFEIGETLYSEYDEYLRESDEITLHSLSEYAAYHDYFTEENQQAHREYVDLAQKCATAKRAVTRLAKKVVTP